MEAVKGSFNKNPDSKRSVKQIVELLKIYLVNNYFTSNNECILQQWVKKNFNNANSFMAKWDQETLSKRPKQSQIYLR